MQEEKRWPLARFNKKTSKEKVCMEEYEKKLTWNTDIRPDNFASLSEMGL